MCFSVRGEGFENSLSLTVAHKQLQVCIYICQSSILISLSELVYILYLNFLYLSFKMVRVIMNGFA